VIVLVLFSQEGAHRHVSQNLKQKLEFIGRQLVTLSMIFSEPPTQGKQRRAY